MIIRPGGQHTVMDAHTLTLKIELNIKITLAEVENSSKDII